MANLEAIKLLNAQYGKKSYLTESDEMNEGFDLNSYIDIKKGLKNELATIDPDFTKYFDVGAPANVALIFIDVCNFSTRFSHLNGEEISKFFDKYYDIIIPIIYKHGGEIDKIIGDGIICVFGAPFLKLSYLDCILAADACAKEIILKTMESDYSSKIAFHSGEIHYFKNKSGLYKEFTMVGKPLTELFRLESVSQNEQINYYNQSDVFSFYNPNSFPKHLTNINPVNKWMHSIRILPSLNGVDYVSAYSIKYFK